MKLVYIALLLILTSCNKEEPKELEKPDSYTLTGTRWIHREIYTNGVSENIITFDSETSISHHWFFLGDEDPLSAWTGTYQYDPQEGLLA